MEELLNTLRSPDGLVLATLIFSCGIGIGAAVVQINSILRRKASDAATSVITWALFLAFSLSASYYLWHSTENLILPSLIGVLAVSSAVGLLVSIHARGQLAAVEIARRHSENVELEQTANVLRAAFRLKRRVRAARTQRDTVDFQL